jgi:hypothetical protein
MPKVRNTVTPEKAYQIVKSAQFINVCAEMIKTEYSLDLVDTRFKNPAVNQHASRIKESANAIQLHTASIIQYKNGVDRDYTTEYSNNLWRILHALIGLDLEHLEEHADYLENALKVSA